MGEYWIYVRLINCMSHIFKQISRDAEVNVTVLLHLQINNGRVCGILSVSRAFGDIQLKTRRLE